MDQDLLVFNGTNKKCSPPAVANRGHFDPAAVSEQPVRS
jgi:hypothetical protein